MSRESRIGLDRPGVDWLGRVVWVWATSQSLASGVVHRHRSPRDVTCDVFVRDGVLYAIGVHCIFYIFG